MLGVSAAGPRLGTTYVRLLSSRQACIEPTRTSSRSMNSSFVSPLSFSTVVAENGAFPVLPRRLNSIGLDDLCSPDLACLFWVDLE